LYLVDSFDRDPLTMLTIGLGVIAGVASRGLSRAVAIGIVIDLLYVVSVGGDFMSGRFMTVPLFAATLILGWRLTPPGSRARMEHGSTRRRRCSTLVLAIAGSRTPNIPLFSDSRFDDRGVPPERHHQRAGFLFLRAIAGARQAIDVCRAGLAPRRGASGRVRGQRDVRPDGRLRIDSGALVHLLDTCALADPLLARLPAVYNNEWRIGHFRRMIPDGYRDSLERRENRLTDPALLRYYDDLRLAIASPSMWTAARWAAIWRLNTAAAMRGSTVASTGTPDRSPS
jgi:arabinofuranosyltransferase